MSDTASNKRQALRRLAEKRRNCRTPRGYEHIEAISPQNATDEYVVPWTKSANNVDSCVMLVAQDWNSIDSLTQGADEIHQHTTGQSKKFKTNRVVRGFLREYLGMRFCDTYATDIIPYLKPGDASSIVSPSALVHCAEMFTIEEIQIVRPRIVICIGHLVNQTLLDAFHHMGHDVTAHDDHHSVVLHSSNTPHVVALFETYHPSYYSYMKAHERNTLIAREWSPVKHHYDDVCRSNSNHRVRSASTSCPLFEFTSKGTIHSCSDTCDDAGNLLQWEE